MRTDDKVERRKIIEGVIVADAWDDNLNLVGARIVGADGREYILEGRCIAAELLELVHERLRVTGTVGEREDGSRTLLVTEWEVLDE